MTTQICVVKLKVFREGKNALTAGEKGTIAV